MFFDAPYLSDTNAGYSGNLIGRINSIRCTDFEKDGKNRKRCMGYLEDEKGKLPFTIFDPSNQYSKGDYILIKDSKIGEFNGKPYLTLSNRNQIMIIEKSKNTDVSNVKLKIKDLKPDMYSLSIKGNLRVTGSKENVGKDSTTMFSGVLSDDTGTIGVRSWGVPLNEGEVEIYNASVKQFKDRLYLNIGKGSEIKIIAKKEEFLRNLEQLTSYGRGRGRGTGLVTKIYSRNPVVEVCPVCGKIVKNGRCDSHPDSNPKKIFRVSITIDDGTLSPNVFLYQKNILTLIGMNEEDADSLISKGEVQSVIDKLENIINLKFVDFSLYGFKGSNSYYMEMEEISVLTDDELTKKYSEIMEELR